MSCPGPLPFIWMLPFTCQDRPTHFGTAQAPPPPQGRNPHTDDATLPRERRPFPPLAPASKRDFILRVVKGPVVLVGNSIGGYISASVAADYPDLVKGLVLVNSAGAGAI